MKVLKSHKGVRRQRKVIRKKLNPEKVWRRSERNKKRKRNRKKQKSRKK